MAQTQVATMSSAITRPTSSSLSNEELRQIEEYGKIVRFRDRVLSGNHPTIKVPSHVLAAKSGNATNQPLAATSSPSSAAASASAATANVANAHSTPSPSRQANRDGAALNRQASQTNSVQSSLTANFPGLGSLPVNGHGNSDVSASSGTPGSAKAFSSARAEIHPIFLEKSDHLIKTEIQMQRQRIERVLRDQLEEQRRNTSWALQPSEPLPDFDLMDVLQKALVLVGQTAPPSTDATVAANNKPDDSDSFDDNTFYSSQFDDSPDSDHVARIPSASQTEDVEMRESPDYEPELNATAGPLPTPGADTDSAPSRQTIPAPEKRQAPGLQLAEKQAPGASHEPSRRIPGSGRENATVQRVGAMASAQATSRRFSHEVHTVTSHESGDASGSAESGGNTDNEQSTDDSRIRSAALAHSAQGFEAGDPTVVRAHDLSPVAPQPSHVSPLATSRQPPENVAERQPPRGTPAQVAALRTGPSAMSSPESSPQAGKASDKRKGKKKNKRKADRQVVDASPYIKNEPRSPSPLSAFPASRPHKRLRPTQRPAEQLNYDEPTYSGAPNDGYRDRHAGSIHREDAPRLVYERRDGSARDGGPRVVVPGTLSYDPDVYEIRRPPTATQFIRNPESSGLYPVHYGPNEARLRSVSHTMVDRPSYREAPIYYRDVRDEPRMSARPGADRERSRSPVMRDTRAQMMAPPPRAATTRIFIDEFGREYIEPSRTPAVIRQSLAPAARPHDNVVYEHPPPPARATSRMPDAYGESVIYRRISPAPYPAPRRVVTEPEYSGGDYRAYRQREYPVAQSGLSVAEEYVPGRPALERLPVEEAPPREYVSRAASVRPVEQVRYTMAGSYDGGLGSVRPEPAREYGVTAHPESRRDVAHPSFPREYSVRPEASLIQRPYSTRPVEQHLYYERPGRGDEDVAFIERPRGVVDGAVYAEAPRREVYR